MNLPLTAALLSNPALLFGSTGGTGVLAFVGARFHRLEKEVRECRKRDADVRIIMAGVRVMAGEMRRELPKSQALAMFEDLCVRRLGPAPDINDFVDLLRQIDDAAPDYEPPEKKR